MGFKVNKLITTILKVAPLAGLITLTACGGGGGSSSQSGGGGGTPVTPIPSPSAPNLIVSISGGSNGICTNVNAPCVSVTICNPNSPSSCVTVPNILLDTGSYGLRVYSSLLTGVTLPVQTQGSNTVAECVIYADGSANWGPVASASLNLGGITTTQSVPMQIINSSFTGASANCSGSSTKGTTPSSFGYNGVLGVGPLINDGSNKYYACNTTSGTCTSTTVLPASQVSNPIAFLGPQYESGLTLKLPSLSAVGGTGAVGYAIFGVGTNSSNAVSSGVSSYQINTNGSPIPLTMSTTSNISSSINSGFLDTGSNGIYFNSTITQCSGWYCPSSTLTIPATNVATTGGVTTSFSIANASSLFGTGNTAFSNLGGEFGTLNQYLDYGLPFFFGKTVYLCFNNKTCNGINATPAWAF